MANPRQVPVQTVKSVTYNKSTSAWQKCQDQARFKPRIFLNQDEAMHEGVFSHNTLLHHQNIYFSVCSSIIICIPVFPDVILYVLISLLGESESASVHVNWPTVVPMGESSAIVALYSELEHTGVKSFTSVIVTTAEYVAVNAPVRDEEEIFGSCF